MGGSWKLLIIVVVVFVLTGIVGFVLLQGKSSSNSGLVLSSSHPNYSISSLSNNSYPLIKSQLLTKYFPQVTMVKLELTDQPQSQKFSEIDSSGKTVTVSGNASSLEGNILSVKVYLDHAGIIQVNKNQKQLDQEVLMQFFMAIINKGTRAAATGESAGDQKSNENYYEAQSLLNEIYTQRLSLPFTVHEK